MPEDVCGTILKTLSTYKQLSHLDLDGNTISAAGRHLAESIKSWGPNPPLCLLWLKDCKMPEHVCGDIAKELSICKQLTHLDLSGNTLGNAGCHLVESIVSWGPDPHLQQLGLKDCKMPEDVCDPILKELSAYKQLTQLDLSGNTLGAVGHHLVESIRSWGPDPQLQALWLKDCKMAEDVCGAILKHYQHANNLLILIYQATHLVLQYINLQSSLDPMDMIHHYRSYG